MTNTSNKADFKTVEIDSEDMLQPNKYDMDKDYVPQIMKA